MKIQFNSILYFISHRTIQFILIFKLSIASINCTKYHVVFIFIIHDIFLVICMFCGNREGISSLPCSTLKITYPQSNPPDENDKNSIFQCSKCLKSQQVPSSGPRYSSKQGVIHIYVPSSTCPPCPLRGCVLLGVFVCMWWVGAWVNVCVGGYAQPWSFFY